MWNVTPRTILVATDFGDASARAARLAGELARAFGARLTALHAETFEAPPYFTSEQVEAIEHQRRNARREAARYLGRTVGQLAGSPVETVISDAPAVDAILEAAANHDLVVIGTHGRRGPSRWWAGSVAERVARRAPVPVLVVRADTPSARGLFAGIQVFAGEGDRKLSARRYADLLASPFRAGDAAPPEPTLAVVVQPDSHPSGAAEQALRTCRVAVLIVPEATAVGDTDPVRRGE